MGKRSELSSFLCFVAFAVTEALPSSSCQNYFVLDDSWRATDFIVGPRDSLNCDDDLQPGWYRFADGLLTTYCPASYSCGTRDPVWMQGQLPGLQDGIVNRTACAFTRNANGILDCCGQEVTIQVQNCHHFILYYLYNTPVCPMAYCVDTGPNPRANSIEITTPVPSLQGPEVFDGGFRFRCTIPEAALGIYDVLWTFDGQPADDVPVEIVTAGTRVAFLDQRAWRGHLGKELRCSVRWRDDSISRVGPFVQSEGYWGGIQVSPPTLTVSEGQGPQEVTLTSTLPIGCSPGDPCELQLEVTVDGRRWDDIVIAGSCLLRLRSVDWDDRNHSVNVSIQIMATRDFVEDGNQQLVVRFSPVYELASSMWNGYTAPELQVLTLDRTTSRCFGYADPHIQGLELPGVIHLYEEGYFVLLRSEQNNFEVQIWTQACAGRACICGLAVQLGSDAISVSICGVATGLPPEIRVLGDEELQAGTRVTRAMDGRDYMIAFTTGQWVRVTDFQSYLNVEVQVTGSEFGNTSGLCGTFDNNTENDLMAPDGHVFPYSVVPTQFLQSWRLPAEASLFSGVLRPVPSSRPVTSPRLYCLCRTDLDISDCGLARAVADPARDNHDCPDCDITRDVSRWRLNGRLGDEDIDEDLGIPEVLYSVPTTIPVATLVTPLSRGTAHTVCTSAMMNLSLSVLCESAVTFHLASFVTSCVEDIMSSGNSTFLISSVASWESSCASDVIRDLSQYHTDQVTGRALPLQVLLIDVCPGQCNLRGLCINGTCVCNTGFAGIDCSVRIDNPPIILRIVRNGLCDARRRPCRLAFLTADNLMLTPDLACRIQEVRLTPDGPELTGKWRSAVADFHSNRQLACHMPDSDVPEENAVQAYLISITTDGQLFSNEALYVVYDVICVTCNLAGNCSVRMDACLIDNLCYRNQEFNPANSTLLCDPKRSNIDWSLQAEDLAVPEISPWDIWTSSQIGCPCQFNPVVSAACACCEVGGCQCVPPNMHQCVQCGHLQDCGRRQASPEFGVDGWTWNTTGCACLFDVTRQDCACCQNGGCQCSRQFRNQCAPCGSPEVCGSKPALFGIPGL